MPALEQFIQFRFAGVYGNSRNWEGFLDVGRGCPVGMFVAIGRKSQIMVLQKFHYGLHSNALDAGNLSEFFREELLS
ncbi:MAG: hypothetical protein IH623_06665 [Verrucomicrobia bacterium]|nr:hypothetical protein [Verrucomicrobiota bacterium]